ncbi:MAG: hypothetical protein ABIS50_01575 [Luteolibacter sp.]|uniref:hypothetical protein n=1 Tax=Luteolibacter sp. TaxID=1962973 RepID=UPI003264E136
MKLSLRHLPLLPLAWLGFLAFPSVASAHRLDEYLQATLVDIEPPNIRLQINLTPGVAVAGQVLDQIDIDHDGVISASETTAYADTLKHDLTVRLDQRELELKTTASEFPPPEELHTGMGIISMEFSISPGSLAAGAHRLTFENRHLPAASVYLFNAALPKSKPVEIIRQKRNRNQSTGEIEFTYQPPPAISSKALGIVASVTGLLLAMGASRWRTAETSRRRA